MPAAIKNNIGNLITIAIFVLGLLLNYTSLSSTLKTGLTNLEKIVDKHDDKISSCEQDIAKVKGKLGM